MKTNEPYRTEDMLARLSNRQMAVIDKLVAQRDELLAAAKLVASKWSGNPEPEWAALDAAIAKIEESR